MTKLENQGDSEAMDCSEEAGTYGLRGHHILGLSDILYNTGDLVTLVHILVASNGLGWLRMASEAVQIHWKTLQFGGTAKLLF